MKAGESKKLEIPFGKDRTLFVYVQMYSNEQVQINAYYYDRLPYSVDRKSLVFSLGITFRL